MFTGIVQATGTVAHIGVGPVRGAVQLVVDTTLDVGSLALGASIAVDGVCLTVVERSEGRFSADLGPETLKITTLGALAPGARVHLERSLRYGDPVDGHLVAGHVDGVGRVVARRERGGSLDLDIQLPRELAGAMVQKGSLAVDGVSLTINALENGVVSVGLIPHTLAVTKLGELQVGAAVNIEVDRMSGRMTS